MKNGDIRRWASLIVFGLLAVPLETACGSGSTKNQSIVDGATESGPDRVSTDIPVEATDVFLLPLDTKPDLPLMDVVSNGDTVPPSPSDKPTYRGLTQPMCVWNQAYQENYAADTVSEILTNASGCYVLLDPFDSTEARAAITKLKENKNIIGCYISVGTCENWRDDFTAIQPYCVTKAWGEWDGEYFVNRTDTGLIDQMKKRIDKMASWGCQFVEFDNMDWTFDSEYRGQYGIAATATQGETYNQTLCTYVHQLGMGCMAKSSAQGADEFDGLTVESSRQEMDWWQPKHMKSMLEAGKIGIVVHYDESDCDGVRKTYQEKYGAKLSFVCEDRASKKYRHFP